MPNNPHTGKSGPLFGLIGYPLGHSFSAGYFTEKFSREGLDGSYLNFPMEDVGRLRELPAMHPGLKGLNDGQRISYDVQMERGKAAATNLRLI